MAMTGADTTVSQVWNGVLDAMHLAPAAKNNGTNPMYGTRYDGILCQDCAMAQSANLRPFLISGIRPRAGSVSMITGAVLPGERANALNMNRLVTSLAQNLI